MSASTALVASIGQDPELWSLEFNHWAHDQCVFRDHCFSGFAFLNRCFSEWCAKESVPCSPVTFERLLRLEGFSIVGQIVYGLLVKSDADYQRKRCQKGESQ